jgi:hypothetical protein
MSKSLRNTGISTDPPRLPKPPVESVEFQAGSLPGPIAESPAQGEKRPHPTDPRRWADGTQRQGVSGVATKSGLYATGHCSPELAAIIGDLDAFRAGVLTDQGGHADIETIRRGYVDKLTSVEGLYRLLAADVMRRGIFTPRGRVRNTFTALLAVIEKWDRLAQRLGMERRQKDALDLSAAEYAATQTLLMDGGSQHDNAPDLTETGRPGQADQRERMEDHAGVDAATDRGGRATAQDRP